MNAVAANETVFERFLFRGEYSVHRDVYILQLSQTLIALKAAQMLFVDRRDIHSSSSATLSKLNHTDTAGKPS